MTVLFVYLLSATAVLAILRLFWSKTAIVFTIAMLVAAVGCLYEASWMLREQKLEKTVAQIVGHNGAVLECQRPWKKTLQSKDALGVTVRNLTTGPVKVVLPAAQCNDLLTAADNADSIDAALAVHILTHEAMHVRGVSNEAYAECLAIQGDYETARALGASIGEAADLAQTYYKRLYPLVDESYQSFRCAPGRSWDSRGKTAAWDFVN